MSIHKFVRDEQGYLEWIQAHTDGFVISTERRMSPEYMVLHHAWCGSIRHYRKNMQPGAFTEREYIKICSTDLPSLREWAREHGSARGEFSSEHVCYR